MLELYFEADHRQREPLSSIKIILLMRQSAGPRGRTHSALEKVSQSSFNSRPASEQDPADLSSLPSTSEVPSEYRLQDPDFFTSGRYLKIWARDGENVDVEIHEKAFILLDQKNTEGPGLLVQYHPPELYQPHKGSFLRNHVLLSNHPVGYAAKPTSKEKTVFLEEGDDDVGANNYIELEHIYNIPFVKYKCVDLGALTPDSLDNLRRHYVNWLITHWRLGKTI
jgi:hypothetical protein